MLPITHISFLIQTYFRVQTVLASREEESPLQLLDLISFICLKNRTSSKIGQQLKRH